MERPKFEQQNLVKDNSQFFWIHYITSLDESGKERIFNKDIPGVRYESAINLLNDGEIEVGTLLLRKPVSIIKTRPEIASSIKDLGRQPLRFKSAEKLADDENRWYLRLQGFPDSIFPAEWFVGVEMAKNINKRDLFTELNSEES